MKYKAVIESMGHQYQSMIEAENQLAADRIGIAKFRAKVSVVKDNDIEEIMSNALSAMEVASDGRKMQDELSAVLEKIQGMHKMKENGEFEDVEHGVAEFQKVMLGMLNWSAKAYESAEIMFEIKKRL